MTNAVGSSRQSTLSGRICNLRVVTLGYIADNYQIEQRQLLNLHEMKIAFATYFTA